MKNESNADMRRTLKLALIISILIHLILGVIIVIVETFGQVNERQSRAVVIRLNSVPTINQNTVSPSNTAINTRQQSTPSAGASRTQRAVTAAKSSPLEHRSELSEIKTEPTLNHKPERKQALTKRLTKHYQTVEKNALSKVTVITNPVYRKWKKPVYPRRSIAKNQQGNVLLDARIDTQGRVIDIEIHQSSGHPLLDRAAIKSVKHWIFEPVKRYGVKTDAMVRVPVNFVLAQR